MSFGMSLLDTMDAAAMSIQDNWQNACAVRTLALLGARLLTLAAADRVRERCVGMLRRLRCISLKWTRDVVQRVQDEGKQALIPELSERALELALTCHMTYDVHEPHLEELLESAEDVAAATESAIVVHDRSPAATDLLPECTQALLRSHARRCHRLEPLLRRRIQECCQGLDMTVGRLWAGYRRGSAWLALAAPDERWVSTEINDRIRRAG